MFKGVYHGKQVHPSDLEAVIQRAVHAGVDRIMITAGSLMYAREALDLTLELNKGTVRFGTTVAVHPTMCDEFEKHPLGAADYLENLIALAKEALDKKLLWAIGEFGLDYYRREYCPRDLQLKYFEMQWQLVEAFPSVPLFLHMREAGQDFLRIVSEKRNLFKNGVVHSFNGTLEEAQDILSLNLYIGINGWYQLLSF